MSCFSPQSAELAWGPYSLISCLGLTSWPDVGFIPWFSPPTHRYKSKSLLLLTVFNTNMTSMSDSLLSCLDTYLPTRIHMYDLQACSSESTCMWVNFLTFCQMTSGLGFLVHLKCVSVNTKQAGIKKNNRSMFLWSMSCIPPQLVLQQKHHKDQAAASFYCQYSTWIAVFLLHLCTCFQYYLYDM